MFKITVIGSGYVGLVTGVCISEMGNQVYCVDVDKNKIADLNKGHIPIYEPGLEELLKNNLKDGRLHFTTSLPEAMNQTDIYFIAVGTPPGEDGSADLKYVLEVAREIGRNISHYSIIVDKSTVPVGTAEKVAAVIHEEQENRGVSFEFDVISNPEFLKEGSAVYDFMSPDRIIIGSNSARATEVMRELYYPFTRNHDRTMVMSVKDAEMTKYASNAMLATKISFMNELSLVCDQLGVDIEKVRQGIGSDHRIGYSFIYAGIGYGGSCFPKDVKALVHIAHENGINPVLLRSVEERNNLQKHRMFEKITQKYGKDLRGLIFSLWGLAFKPGTDDMREAPSLVIISDLIQAGAKVAAFDPVAMEAARHVINPQWIKEQKITFSGEQYETLKGTEALILATEWKIFRNPDFTRIKNHLKNPVIFDGRNQYDPAHLTGMGFSYFGIGH